MENILKKAQDYIIGRIINCDFDKYEVKLASNDWFHFNTIIDGLEVNFGIIEYCGEILYCPHLGDFKVDVGDANLQPLFNLAINELERIRMEKIQSLEKELAELKN